MARMAHQAPLRLVLAVALLLLAVPFTLGSAGSVATAATVKSSAKTVNGNWHPFEPLGHYDADADHWIGEENPDLTPSVTVDQTTNLSDQFVNVTWKDFTATSNAGDYADPDGNVPAAPFRLDGNYAAFYGVEIFECRGLTPTLNPINNVGLGDKAECYDASVFASTDGDHGPNNRLSTVTQSDGTGQASFHVENTSNDLLRCSPRQPCSIVVVPNQGGERHGDSLDKCGNHDQDVAYGPDYTQAQYANSDPSNQLSPCSWSKRITIPLSFAPVAAACPDLASSFSASGSPPLARGLSQLLTGWCRGSKPVSFDYDFSSSEVAARTRFLTNVSTGLSSDTDVALTSEPADPSLVGQRPFAYAPIANDAVSIPYAIDNVRTGRPITDLRLSARLVAKLLTQSYAPISVNCPVQEQQVSNPAWCAKDIRSNPTSIFDDKEFQQLNFRGDHPDRESFPKGGNITAGSQQGLGSFFPTVAGGDSDMTYLLTKWIAADPDANDFLRGVADHEMRINPNYRVKGSVLYPITSFTALDPGYTAPNIAYGGSADPSFDLRTKQGMQATWAPVGSPSQVLLNLARNRSSAYAIDGTCSIDPNGSCYDYKANPSLSVNFSRTPPEPNGARDLTAVTDNTDAQAVGLPSAQLLTSGGDFVEPSQTSMAKAAAALHTNQDGVTQSLDFGSAPSDAYPLLLPQYAMVPTCGISKAKAAGIKGMLNRVLSSQTYGSAPGTLVKGLLKLTSSQLADTRKAETLVSSKRCPAPAGGGNDSNGGNNGGAGDNGDNARGAGGGNAPGGAPTGKPTSPAASPSAAAPGVTNSGPAAKAENVGFRSDDNGGALALLPILLLLGGLILVGGPLAWWGAGTGPGQVAVARARHLAREGVTDLRNLLPSRWRR